MDGYCTISQVVYLKVFLSAVQDRLKTGPVLLFVDGHNSHLALDLLGLARANNTTYCLPPNTTHILQPLDVGVFGPLKTSLEKESQGIQNIDTCWQNYKERFPCSPVFSV